MSHASSRRSEWLSFREGIYFSSPLTSPLQRRSQAFGSGKRNVPPRLTNSLSPVPEPKTRKDIYQPTYAYSSTSSINCGLSTYSRPPHQAYNEAVDLSGHEQIQSVIELERNGHSIDLDANNTNPPSGSSTPVLGDSSNCNNKVDYGLQLIISFS